MSTKYFMESVIIAAGMATLPAWADPPAISARATITGLQINLIDLRPDDGIAPSLQWVIHPYLSYALADIGTSPCFDSPLCVIDKSDKPLDTLSVSASGRGATAAASIGPENWSASLTSSPADYPRFARNVHAGVSLLDDSFTGGIVTLSPHTALSVTGHYTLEVEAQPGAGNLERFVYARIAMRSWQHNFSEYAWFDITPEGNHASKSSDFNWYLENNLNVAHTKGGYLGLGVGTAPPVPEPGTWALMLAGLAMMGVAAKRQQDAGC